MWMLLILLLTAVASFSSAEQCTSLDCSSHGYRFASCRVAGADAITRVEVVRKYSRSACTYGRSYGPGQGVIWVNRGCRARFRVCFETGVHCTSRECSSRNYRFALCPVSGARRVVSVQVARRYSRSRCTSGHSYGKDNNKIWVNHGCRAEFRVCFV